MNFAEYQVAVGLQNPHHVRLSLSPEEYDRRCHLLQRALYDLTLQAESLDIPLATIARLSLEKGPNHVIPLE